jgi:hypothetical protein
MVQIKGSFCGSTPPACPPRTSKSHCSRSAVCRAPCHENLPAGSLLPTASRPAAPAFCCSGFPCALTSALCEIRSISSPCFFTSPSNPLSAPVLTPSLREESASSDRRGLSFAAHFEPNVSWTIANSYEDGGNQGYCSNDLLTKLCNCISQLAMTHDRHGDHSQVRTGRVSFAS